MKKIEAIIRVSQLQTVIDALVANEVHGLTCSKVQGFGRQHGNTEVYRSSTISPHFVDKAKIEIVIPAEKLQSVIDIILASAYTGEVGDGKVFVYDIENTYRIRTKETDISAL